MKLNEITDADKEMNPLHFRNDPADIRMRITSKFDQIRISDQFWCRQPKLKRSSVLGVGGGIRCPNIL